uniref:Variant surface glycoprotein 447 n=1 Tax=Trypanosoma brucei TaxID=5691 RepID=M4TD97_9TRYP|nr:variant surface glycoprotein 447 [Trypanosoma brucei]
MRSDIIAFMLLSACGFAQQADAGTNEAKNLAEMGTLCSLINLAETSITGLSEPGISEDDLDAIKAVNITLADPEWTKQFPTEPTAAKQDAPNCKDPSTQAQCNTQWLEWKASSIKANGEGELTKKIQISNEQKLSPQGQAAANQAAAITEAALQLKQTYNDKYKPDLDEAATKIKADLELAVFGQSTAGKNPESKCVAPEGTDRQTMCALPSVGKALCITLLCVCTKDGVSNSDDVCGDTRTPTLTWAAAAAAPAQYASLDAICKKHTNSKVTSEFIIQKLGQLFGMLKTTTHASGDMIHLGSHTGSQHCDKQANSACADFTKAYPLTSGGTAASIAWEQHLLDAVEKLKKADHAAQEKRRTEATIKALRGQVELVFNRAAMTEVDATKSPNPIASPPICTSHKTNPTCTEDSSCKWEGKTETDGTCKPKEGEGQANAAGTGEGAAERTYPNCSQCTDLEQCAKAAGKPKEGKKSVCGWIEGKCQDFSFLLNKKLALIAAVFMSLVAL